MSVCAIRRQGPRLSRRTCRRERCCLNKCQFRCVSRKSVFGEPLELLEVGARNIGQQTSDFLGNGRVGQVPLANRHSAPMTCVSDHPKGNECVVRYYTTIRRRAGCAFDALPHIFKRGMEQRDGRDVAMGQARQLTGESWKHYGRGQRRSILQSPELVGFVQGIEKEIRSCRQTRGKNIELGLQSVLDAVGLIVDTFPCLACLNQHAGKNNKTTDNGRGKRNKNIGSSPSDILSQRIKENERCGDVGDSEGRCCRKKFPVGIHSHEPATTACARQAERAE